MGEIAWNDKILIAVETGETFEAWKRLHETILCGSYPSLLLLCCHATGITNHRNRKAPKHMTHNFLVVIFSGWCSPARMLGFSSALVLKCSGAGANEWG